MLNKFFVTAFKIKMIYLDLVQEVFPSVALNGIHIIWQTNTPQLVLPLLKDPPYYSSSFPDRQGYLVDSYNKMHQLLLRSINNRHDDWNNQTTFYNIAYPYLALEIIHNIRIGNSKINLVLNANLVETHFLDGTLPPGLFYVPVIHKYVSTVQNDLKGLSDMVLPTCLDDLGSTEFATSTTPLFTHQKEGLRWLQHVERLIDQGEPIGQLDSLVPFPNTELFWDAMTHSLSFTGSTKLPLYSRGGMLGDGIGSGKTLLMLSLIVADLQSPCPRLQVPPSLRSRATLVICGKQLATQWKQQVQEHFGSFSLKVVMITDKLQHQRTTLEQVLTADLVIITMSFLCGSYYRDQFIGQRITPDIAPLSLYHGYLWSLPTISGPSGASVVLEHIQFRRLILDEADMYLNKLPYADPDLEHQYQRRLSQHCRVNSSLKTEPFIYTQCLSADFRWIVTSTANFSDLSQQAAFVSFLGLSVGQPSGTLGPQSLLSTPRTLQPLQPLSLDRALIGPSTLERTLVKNAFQEHLLLARSQTHIFQSMSLPPLLTDVIWVTYSEAERNLVSGALELDTDYNFRRHVHAFPLQVTQQQQEEKQQAASASMNRPLSIQEASEVMLGAQRRRLLELEQSVEQARHNLEEVDRVRTTATEVLVNVLNHRHLQLTNEVKSAEDTMGAIQRAMTFLEASLNSKDPCTICMDSITTIITPCGHKFCGSCLQRCLQERPRCPTCRSPCPQERCIPLKVQEVQGQGGISTDYGSRFRALLTYLGSVRSSEPEAQFLVFSEWDKELEKQATLLGSEGFRCAQIKGNTHVCQNHVKQFQEGVLDVLFLSLQSMASGLHLVRANHVIILTPLGAPYDRADQIERQAIGRCHRIGQTKPVYVKHFIVKGSLEEEIYRERFGQIIQETKI